MRDLRSVALQLVRGGLGRLGLGGGAVLLALEDVLVVLFARRLLVHLGDHLLIAEALARLRRLAAHLALRYLGNSVPLTPTRPHRLPTPGRAEYGGVHTPPRYQ